MADPFAALAPELRALGAAAKPEEIQGVLAYLLTQDGVQAGLEPLATTLVEQGGYGSLVALANMGREGLAELGMSAGVKDTVLGVVRPAQPKAQVIPTIEDGGQQPEYPTGPPVTHTQPPPRQQRIPTFPELLPTGYPTKLSWDTYTARLVTAVRAEMGMVMGNLVSTAMASGVRPTKEELPAMSHENQSVWRLLTTSGDNGIPDSLMRRFPLEVRQNGQGIEACLFVREGVVAHGDQAAETVAAWLQAPPQLPANHRFKLGTALTTFDEMIDRAKSLGLEYSEVARKLILKSMVAKIPEVVSAWRSLDTMHEDAPSLALVRAMLNRKALSYASSYAEASNATALSAIGSGQRVNEAAYGATNEGECFWWTQGNCVKGDKCPYSHGEKKESKQYNKTIDGVPIPKPRSAGESQATAWLLRSLEGLAESKSLPVWVVMIACVIGQRDSRGWDMDKANEVANSDVTGVVADTGATIKGIGTKHMGRARNMHALERPIKVDTAKGIVFLTEGADLPVQYGLMNGGVVLPESQDSLLPVVPVCQDDDLGFEVAQGATGARFYKEAKDTCDKCGEHKRETVVSLEREGRLFTMPIQEDGGTDVKHGGEMRDEQWWDADEDESDYDGPGTKDKFYDCKEIRKVRRGTRGGKRSKAWREHAGVMSGTHSCYTAVPRVWRVNKELRDHRLDQHQPARPDICPECQQALKREQRAERGEREANTRGAAPTEWQVDSDLTGPHDPDVDGHTWAHVCVEHTVGYGGVGLMDAKGAGGVLESLKEFERDIKAQSKREGRVVAHHHDDDKAFRGVVEVYAREQGWKDTHTGGHRPSSNAVCERRIGMLNQLFRVLLLTCTGGLYYYDQLWGHGLRHGNYVLNRKPFKRLQGQSPLGWLKQSKHLKRSKSMHVFGAYCMWKVSGAQKAGKWQPNSEKGIWVGLNTDVVNGHLVVPIKWSHKNKCWDLLPTVTATTVKVYDDVFPLKMTAPSDKKTEKFENFVEAVFDPLTRSEAPEPVEQEDEEYVVEKIIRKRGRGEHLEYLVKYGGYSNRYNRWLGAQELEGCKHLILDFVNREKERKERSKKGKPGRPKKAKAMSATGAFTLLMAMMVTDAVTNKDTDLVRLPGLNALQAVEECLRKQPSCKGTPEDYVEGYEREISHMLSKRLRLVQGAEEEHVRQHHQLVSMRMNLEDKRDGRRKGRLVLQGFKEPAEWDVESNEAPVTLLSTIRTLVFANEKGGGDKGEVLSTIDVSVAFLQAEEYGPNEAPRYVTFRPVKGGKEYVFQLRGPVYGQRSAPRAWYKTLAEWMIKDEGYVRAKHDPCLFTHPITKHRVAIVVDDMLCRGGRDESAAFYLRLRERFEAKEPTFLETDTAIDFCGLTLRRWQQNNQDWYSLDQEAEVLTMLENCGLGGATKEDCPMPTKSLLTDDKSGLTEEEEKWCRKVIGGLNNLARGTRWDIAHAASRVSQRSRNPDGGTKKALVKIAGYLRSEPGHKLSGPRGVGVDTFEYWTDSDHWGDSELVRGSRSGLLVRLNGVPVHWRSSVQKAPAISPAEAEIYALSEGVRDCRHVTNVAEEMAVDVKWPLKVQVDNDQAMSFCNETCVRSKMRGCFDLRDEWVKDLRNKNLLLVEKVNSEDNLADFFTKCFSKGKFNGLKRRIIK